MSLLPVMTAMILIMGLLILRLLTHIRLIDIRQQGLPIRTQLQVLVTMDTDTTGLNTLLITDMAIMDLDTLVTMGIDITDPGINVQSCIVHRLHKYG